MVLRLEAVTFDASDPAALGSFWASLLGRTEVEDGRGVLVPGDATQVGLRFVRSDSEQVGERRLHLHLTSDSREDQERTVAEVLRLGGQHLDVGQDPEDPWVVLGDPEGNELCVIDPGNAYLAGTGRLGEVTCDGTWAVGLFWRDALGWPLVWDQDEETAVQAPAGGTKVAWGGPPVAPRHGRNRQRFDLLTDDPGAEAERLVELGARVLVEWDGGAELDDPDGNEFGLHRG